MITAVIDRVEEDKAVLLIGEDEQKAVFPAGALPEGIGEGDYVRIEISYDEEATRSAREEAEALLRDLQQE